MPSARSCALEFGYRDVARSETRWRRARRRRPPRGTHRAEMPHRSRAAGGHQRAPGRRRARRAAARCRSPARTPSLAMQLSTISPAPRRCTSSTQSRVPRVRHRGCDLTSPVNCCTRYSPSTRLAVDADHHALRAEALAERIDQLRIRERGRVDRDLSPRRRPSTSSASATLRMPPATQNGMSRTRATRSTQQRSTERPSRARGDVVEHQLIGAFVAVARARSMISPTIAVIAKAHALDHLAVAHVEAGNYAFGKNGPQLLDRECAPRAAPCR